MSTYIPRGRIRADYRVSCGRCYDDLILVSTRQHGGAVGNAEAEGWKYTKSDGWVCPRCQERDSKTRRAAPPAGEG